MKSYVLKWLFFLGMIFFVPSLKGQSYQALWEKMETCERKYLYKSVVQLVDTIIRKAECENDFQQKLKATVVRMKYRMRTSPDSMYQDLSHLQEWAEQESDAVHQKILQLVIGNIYDDINRQISLGRYYKSPNASYIKASHVDISHINELEQLKEKILSGKKQAYRQAVSDMPLLAKVNTESYKTLIEKGEESGYYGHDLLSFMVCEISKHCLNESDYDFVISLYDRLIAYYQSAGMDTAMWMSKLAKVGYEYDYDKGSGPALVDTLQCWIRQNTNKSVAPNLYHSLVEKTDSDSLCYVWATEALKLYPDYKFADCIKSRVDDMTCPRSSISLLSPPLYHQPLEFSLSYRMLDKVSIKLFSKTDGKLVTQTVLDLEPAAPYVSKDTVFNLPPLPEVGKYIVEMQAGDRKKQMEVNYTLLYPVIRQWSDGRCEVIVLNNTTGAPIENAAVEILKSNRHTYTLAGKVQTDAKGKALFETDDIQSLAIMVQKDGYGCSDTIDFHNSSANFYINRLAGEAVQVKLFTDRAVYYPGQVMHIGGVVYSETEGEYKVEKGKKLTLYIDDAKKRTRAKIDVNANDMGTFSTQLLLPEKDLSGEISVRCGDYASVRCIVREYKRPPFEVRLSSMDESCVLGDSVMVKGEAVDNAGNPVANASVAYEISSDRTCLQKGKSNFVSGRTVTDAEGHFTFFFIPETYVSSLKDRNSFYKVEVEVMDGSENTQKASRIFYIPSKYLFNIIAPDFWVKEQTDSMTVDVYGRNYQLLDMVGRYTVASLEKVNGKKIAGKPFYTGVFHSGAAFRPEWIDKAPSGEYQIVYEMTDSRNRVQKKSVNFVLFSMSDLRSPVDDVLWSCDTNISTDKENSAIWKVGTSAENVHLFYDVFSKDRHLQSEHYVLSDTLLTFSYEKLPEYEGGITVQCVAVKDGICYKKEFHAFQQKKNLALDMKWHTFRNHVIPGQKEIWKLQISMPDGKAADADLMVTLYDASFDRYWPHQWFMRLQSVSEPPRVFLDESRRYSAWDNSISVNLGKDDKQRVRRWVPDHWTDYLNFAVPQPGKYADIELNNPRILLNKYYASMLLPNEKAVYDKLSSFFYKMDADEILSDFSGYSFFNPDIRTDENGMATMAFALPQGVSAWTLKGFAHTDDMHYGLIYEQIINKNFKLHQQLPSLVYAKEKTVLSAVLDNHCSEKNMKGVVTMELFDPQTKKVYVKRRKNFDLKAGESTTVSFDVRIDKSGSWVCRMVADGDTCSDGEQRCLLVMDKKKN